MPGVCVGVTAARFEACRRGLAANIGAIAARREAGGGSWCVVDANPAGRDVGTRLGISGPTIERFASRAAVSSSEVLRPTRLAYPALHVVPCAPGAFDRRFGEACARALAELRARFELVIVDLPLGAGRPGPTLDARLVDHLDWLLVATTPDPEAVDATARYLGLLEAVRARGGIAPHVRAGVVLTGDEGSTSTGGHAAARGLGALGEVTQLWGRARPNLGFGPTLGFESVEGAVERLLGTLTRSVAVTPA